MRKNQNVSNSRRVLNKLWNLKGKFDFDIYDFGNKETPCTEGYLVVLHRDNGGFLRQTLANLLSASDSNLVYILRECHQSAEISLIISRGKIEKEFAR